MKDLVPAPQKAVTPSEEIQNQRDSIQNVIRKSLEDGWMKQGLIASGPFLSPAKKLSTGLDPTLLPTGPQRLPPRLVRYDVSDNNTEATSKDNSIIEENAEENVDEDTDSKKGDQRKPVTIEFVYSDEVAQAVSKIKSVHNVPWKKRLFGRSEVHIFNLPEIIRNGAPRNPFTPTVTTSLDRVKLPMAQELTKLPKTKRKFKAFSEDQYGVYLSWRVGQFSMNPDLMPKPKYIPRRERYRELPESAVQREQTARSASSEQPHAG